MKKLTQRQKEVLDFVVAHCATKGFPPTRLDIADHFGFKSPNAAEEHLRCLVRRGRITLARGTSRGISVVGQEVGRYAEIEVASWLQCNRRLS